MLLPLFQFPATFWLILYSALDGNFRGGLPFHLTHWPGLIFGDFIHFLENSLVAAQSFRHTVEWASKLIVPALVSQRGWLPYTDWPLGAWLFHTGKKHYTVFQLLRTTLLVATSGVGSLKLTGQSCLQDCFHCNLFTIFQEFIFQAHWHIFFLGICALLLANVALKVADFPWTNHHHLFELFSGIALKPGNLARFDLRARAGLVPIPDAVRRDQTGSLAFCSFSWLFVFSTTS